MISLDKFREQIEIADRPLGVEYMAYRMDGASAKRPDMRLDIGVGTCHCCDYFMIQEGAVLLIEETRLMETINGYQDEFDSMLAGEKRDKFFNRRIRDENILKVYGSLLVLLRWAAKHSEISDSISGKIHNFWLVASDAANTETGDTQINFDTIKDRLFGGLRTTLKKSLIGDVEILTPDQLKSKLNP